MKGLTLAALAAAVLLCGCAAPNGASNGQDSVVDRSEAPLGSYIKRKTPARITPAPWTSRRWRTSAP